MQQKIKAKEASVDRNFFMIINKKYYNRSFLILFISAILNEVFLGWSFKIYWQNYWKTTLIESIFYLILFIYKILKHFNILFLLYFVAKWRILSFLNNYPLSTTPSFLEEIFYPTLIVELEEVNPPLNV